MHSRIDNAFRNAGIEIAFPQRDIHIRSIRDSLPVTERETFTSKQRNAQDKGVAPDAAVGEQLEDSDQT
jgi:small-conductance mechanosensitive channel